MQKEKLDKDALIEKLSRENEKLRLINDFVAEYRENISPYNMVIICDTTWSKEKPYYRVEFNYKLEDILDLIDRNENITLYNANSEEEAIKHNYIIAWTNCGWAKGAEVWRNRNKE